jgi:Inorganic pyrophosphatase
VIKAWPVGAIEAKQKENGEKWERNDRLIAVAVHSETHTEAKSSGDLRPHLVEEIKRFFITTMNCAVANLSRSSKPARRGRKSWSRPAETPSGKNKVTVANALNDRGRCKPFGFVGRPAGPQRKQ